MALRHVKMVRAHDWGEAWHRRILRRGLLEDRRLAAVSGSLNDQIVTASELARHYSRFRVGERLLLTGHSHQAWPDVAFDAQQRAWLDAADLVDDKWERAAAIADEVRDGWRRLLNDRDGEIALGQNTHELVVRCFRRAARSYATLAATLVTTDGEFHTIRRQLDRLAEAGLDVVKVAARPVDTLAERIAAVVDDRVGVRPGVVRPLRDRGDRAAISLTPRDACDRARRGAAGRRLPSFERRAV